MGNKQTQTASAKEKEEVTSKNFFQIVQIGRNSFEFSYVIGRGGFGKV